MSWKFWKKDSPVEFVIESASVPASTLFRWFLYDTGVGSPNKFATAAGFTPISEEGEDLEKQDSRERLERVIPFKDYLNMMANITGEVFAESMLKAISKSGLVEDTTDMEDEKDALIDICTTVAMAALVPSFSAALELGIIVNPGAFTVGDDNE